MDSPIAYYGGKTVLADTLISIMPEHIIYCEPFFGGGAVFFRKPSSKIEVINDHNERLITFYMQLQSNYKELISALKNTLHSESFYKRAKNIYNNKSRYSDLEMAWSVWLLTNSSFAHSPKNPWRWENDKTGTSIAKTLATKRAKLSIDLYDRLKNVQISCRDALRVISDRDTPNTLFYLDPPYPGANQGHYCNYTFYDLENLLKLLTTIEGKFILTNYPSQLIKYYVIVNGWTVSKKESATWKMGNANTKGSKKTQEVIVTNFSQSLYEQGKIEF